MEEILKYIIIIGVHAAAVCAIFAILFINAPVRWPLRVVTVVLGGVAVAMPFLTMFNTLGYPDPWPEPGEYEVLGWKFDESRRAIYTFVRPPHEQRPRLYKVDFKLDTALALQDAREHPEHLARIDLIITGKAEGPPDVAFEFEKRTVIFSPAEQEERERAEREFREAREAQLEQEQREEELESLERMKVELAGGRSGGKDGKNDKTEADPPRDKDDKADDYDKK